MRRRTAATVDASSYRRFSTEAELQKAIELQADALGFRVFHDELARGKYKGFPDLVICGPNLLMFVECKGPRGRVSDDQAGWISDLVKGGHLAFVASTERPEDFDNVVTLMMDAYEAQFAAERGV